MTINKQKTDTFQRKLTFSDSERGTPPISPKSA